MKLIRRLACLLTLLSPWAAAGNSPDPAVLESLGMYVASLQRGLERYREVRGLSNPTEHQAGVLDLLLRDAQILRLQIGRRARALPPDCDQAKVVKEFMETWTEARLAEGIRLSARESGLDPAVRRLARALPEERSIGTLFPLFRP